MSYTASGSPTRRHDLDFAGGHHGGPAGHEDDTGTEDFSSDTMSSFRKMARPVYRAAKARSKKHRWAQSSSDQNSSGGGAEAGTVPWLKFAGCAPDDKPTLRYEMECFRKFMSLTDAEKASRNMLRVTVQEQAESFWPTCSTKVYGSFALSLSLPDSDIDANIEQCGEITKDTVDKFMLSMTERGFENCGSLYAPPFVFCKCKHPKMNITCNICLTPGTSLVRESVRNIQKLLDKYPEAGSVIMAIRTMHQQSNLPLSGFCSTLMVLRLCQLYPDDEHRDAGEILKTFLRHYSTEFDYKTKSIDVHDVNASKPPAHCDSPVSICDPLDANNNVAPDTVPIQRIRIVYAGCAQALDKWNGPATPADAVFRGRTPLATIVAVKPLWDRCDRLRPAAVPVRPGKG
ncbi:Poly(A) RNA polymerase protein 1 [Diplonema papillatum]|nr:Poly(A) RNA polymerase protein 1 [Diplonema papillatum]